MILDKTYIFIIGSPRSGTTWLQTMIGAHPLVCTTVELTLFQYAGAWMRIWEKETANLERRKISKGLPFLWTEDEFYNFLGKFLITAYEHVLANNPQATHILDKNPGYSMYVRDMIRLLPNARFIHMIRDGRDVAVSMVSARQKMGFGTDTISSSAEAWKANVLAAQETRSYPDQYLEVRYEDLSTAGVDTLKSVFDFCRLPIDVETIVEIENAHRFEKMKMNRTSPDKNTLAPDGHFHKGNVGSWREELNLIQRYFFDEIAGDVLRETGYAEADWWAETSSQRILGPLLAAISVLKRIHRKSVNTFAVLFDG